MASVNALSVALFNAAAGGYSADIQANPAAYAVVVGAVLEKDLSSNAAFVEHLLVNFGIATDNAVYAEAQTALTAMVAGTGRANATVSAIDFLAAVPRDNAFAAVANAFFAKVDAAAAFSRANTTELDVSKLISGVTGVDTDVVAAAASFAAGAASRDSEVNGLQVSVAGLRDELAAAQAATTAATAAAATAATAAAATLKAAQDAAAALKLETDAAAKTAADALAAANATIRLIDDTEFASESAAAAAAKAAAEAVAKTAADAAAKTAADAATAAAATLKAAQDAAAALKLETDAAAKTAADALAAANTTITTLQNPAGGNFALTASTTDVLIGVGSADQFTGTTATTADTDTIVDAVRGDNDTLTLTATAAVPALRTINVENINVALNSLAADTVDAANFAGVENLNVTRGDVTVGGATLTGNKVVTVNMNAANVAAVTAGVATTDVTVVQITTAGATINANNASGNVTVTGAATINATGAGAGDTVNVIALGNAVQDARAVSITTGAATVTTDALFTGAIAIDAANATTVTVAGASGGVTINAPTGARTANDGIDVRGIDASGATIATGTYLTTAQGTIDIGGTALTTDTATISGGGLINLNAGIAVGAVDILNLQSNGTAVTYNIASTIGTPTNYTGQANVTIAGNVNMFSGTTATTFAAIDLNAGAAAAINAINWNVTSVDLGFDNANNAITVPNGLSWEVTTNQAGLNFDFATTTVGDLNIVAGDVNGANTAIGTLLVGAFDAAAGTATTAGTVSIASTLSNFTATSTVLGAAQTLVVTGNQNTTLGAVTALAVNAANSTGVVTLTAGANVGTVATGSGRDVVTLDGARVHTVSTGNGADTITVTNTNATSTIDAGDGDDVITLTSTNAYVVIGGAGNDTFRTGEDINAVILGGDGTDTFTITGGTLDFSNNTQFSLNSIEVINLTAAAGATTLSSAQLAANPVFSIIADGDQLNINVRTAAGSLDASGITIAAGSTAALNYTGGTGANVMTGGAQNETFRGGLGADTINGGGGSDTFVLEGVSSEAGSVNASVGMVVNLSATAISAAQIISDVAGRFLGGSATTVAAGTATHLYDEVAALNASVVDTLISIENITGGAGDDYIVGSADDNVLNGGAGNDFISGGDGDDTINGGAGNDTLTGGAGADDFILSNIVSAAGAVEIDTITDFTVAQGDQLGNISIANIELLATVADLVAARGAGVSVTAGAVVTSVAVVGAAVNFNTLTAGTNVVLINGDFANSAALQAAIRANVTVDGALDADDAFIVVYDTGVNSFVALVTAGAAILDNGLMAAATVTDLVTLTGLADATTLTNASFLAFA